MATVSDVLGLCLPEEEAVEPDEPAIYMTLLSINSSNRR